MLSLFKQRRSGTAAKGGQNLGGTLVARGLTKSYRGRKVVDGASMALRAGEAVGLLGPNGAGKTTCFYMLDPSTLDEVLTELDRVQGEVY